MLNEDKAESVKNDVSNLGGLFDSLFQSPEEEISDSLYSCSGAAFGTKRTPAVKF